MAENNPIQNLSDAVEPALPTPPYVLRLYVTGTTQRSAQAVINIKRICEKYLPDGVDLEVIDIYRHPESAKDAQVIAAPTLIKLLPEPLRRAIGDLSDEDKVLAALDISPKKT